MATRERVKVWEQQADHLGLGRIYRRASLPPGEISYRNQQPPSPVRAGTNAGSHPENTPYSTTQTHQGNTHEHDEIYPPQRMPSSARKYRPLAPVPVTEAPRPSFSFQRFLLQCLAVIALAVLLALVWFSFVLPAFQNWHDGITYGNPRIYQVDAPNIGHVSGHFIAVNNHGTIELLQIPDHPDKGPLHMWIIARYTSDTASTLPITNISFSDVNGDGLKDIEITVSGTEYILFDDGKGNFSFTSPQKG